MNPGSVANLLSRSKRQDCLRTSEFCTLEGKSLQPDCGGFLAVRHSSMSYGLQVSRCLQSMLHSCLAEAEVDAGSGKEGCTLGNVAHFLQRHSGRVCPDVLVVCAQAVHTMSQEQGITSAMQSTVCLEYQYWLSSGFSGFLKASTKGQKGLKQQLQLRGKAVEMQ